MTLNTRVYVLDKVDVHELFREAQRLLGLADDGKRGPDRQQWSNEQDRTWRGGVGATEPGNPWMISNEVGQGLPGWLMVHYRTDGHYRTAEQAAVHSYCNHPDAEYYEPSKPTCRETEHDPVCWAELSIDTAYGYRGPNGYGCGDLHAAYVAGLGEWLDGRGLRWKWLNEFTGEVHEGYDRLIELASGGFEASAWFRTTALPAIAAHAATTGGAS